MKAIFLPSDGWTRRAAIGAAGAWVIGGASGCHAAAQPDSTPPDRTGGALPRRAAYPPAPADALTPEMFGAKGDGVTNDTAAFGRLSQALTRRGGGTVALRKTVYLVGEQRRDSTPGAGYAFGPSPLLDFVGLRGSLTILGNGATLRCAPGLRFGTFDARTGQPTHHPVPFINPAERATPYQFMIRVEGCAGAVTISDIELDGNLPRLVLGGPYGDTGIQIAGSGIFLRDNRGSQILRNVHSHHHPQDGVMIDDIAGPARGRIRKAEDVRCEYNGRQGCSLVGGGGWLFARCRFNHTGRAGLASAPGAGFDIEAEGGKTIRDVRFEDCEFADNYGCGLVADSGDSDGASFLRCRFIGTTMWSVWPNKPHFRFVRCTIVGTAVRCFGDPDEAKATQFHDCLFTDDPKLSPSGKVYREDRADGPLADLSDSRNVLFNRCRLLAVAGAVLPWSTGAIYADCVMRQGVKSQGYPRGEFRGKTSLTGNVDLYNSRFTGELTVNGSPFPPR
jgi:hypothetical protein